MSARTEPVVPTRRITDCVVLSAAEAARAPALRERWEQVARSRGGLNGLFHSPVWLQSWLRDAPDEKLFVAVVHDYLNQVSAVVPLRLIRYPLRFHVGKREVARLHMRAVRLARGYPQWDDPNFVGVIRSVLKHFPEADCLLMDSIAVGESVWRDLLESKETRREGVLYVPYGVDHCYSINLVGTFEDYVAKFKSKTRNTLKKKQRRLMSRGDGKLALQRIEKPEDVLVFLSEAEPISLRDTTAKSIGAYVSQDADAEKMALMAESGVLRSYLLWCGGKVCAFVRGFQYSGVFYYDRVGFDQAFAAYSPGTVLLYMLIEDLFGHNTPTHLNFYAGTWAYKEMFATSRTAEASVMIARRSARGFAPIAMHATFNWCTGMAKTWLRR